MRVALAAVLVVPLCSCHHPSSVESWPTPDLAQASKESDSGTPGLHRLAVGDTMADVTQRIEATGGKNLSGCVGVIDYPLSSWYVLRDGTCLQVTPAAIEGPGSDVVGRLTLGEPGRGYGGWERWDRQRHREVQYVDLR